MGKRTAWVGLLAIVWGALAPLAWGCCCAPAQTPDDPPASAEARDKTKADVLAETYSLLGGWKGAYWHAAQRLYEEKKHDAALELLDEATQELTIKAALGLPSEVVNKTKVKVGRGIAGWVAKTAEPLMLPEQAETMPHLKAAMVQEEVSSALCMPLIAKGRVIGVLNSSKRMRGAPFTSSDLELLSILCGQAAIAIENAKLFENVKMQQARAERLLRQTIVAQEDERKRISLENPTPCPLSCRPASSGARSHPRG